MSQVREEQAARAEVLRLWLGKHQKQTPPTDEEVEAKISEAEEAIGKNLIEHNSGEVG